MNNACLPLMILRVVTNSLNASLNVEIVLKFLFGAAVFVGQVFDDDAVFEEGDARGDLHGVLQVVGRDEDGGSCLFVIGGEHLLQDVLRRGVEEVEGLVEDDEAWLVEEGCHDAYFLLVACAEVAYEFLLVEDFAVHELLEVVLALLYGWFVHCVCLADELEIFFGREEVDEECLVDIGSGVEFPVFVLGGVDAVDDHFSLVGFQEVEEHAEEGGLSGSVVSHESEDVAFVDGEIVDVDGGLLAEGLFEVADSDVHDDGACGLMNDVVFVEFCPLSLRK